MEEDLEARIGRTSGRADSERIDELTAVKKSKKLFSVSDIQIYITCMCI